jgi:hypothetical protein
VPVAIEAGNNHVRRPAKTSKDYRRRSEAGDPVISIRIRADARNDPLKRVQNL